jgi:hypothetical protein
MSIRERSAIEEAKRWGHTRLTSNADLLALIPRVYVDTVQREINGTTKFPYILGNFMAGIDIPALGTERIQTHADFQWRVVTEGVPTANDRAAELLMDNLLQTTVVDLSYGWLFTCRRIAPLNRLETDAQQIVRYHNFGGIYRLWVSAAP